MTYALEKDGDFYEIRYWELLRKDFPNYEIFWSRFILLLTKRADGQGIGLKEGTNPLLESMAMAHYTVFYHLGVAADLHKKLGQEFSEDILFHLSSATEMVERLIFTLSKLAVHLEGGKLPEKLTEEAITTISHSYFSSKNYTKDYERFLHRGQAVNSRLHNIEDVTKPLMLNISEQATKDFEEWQDTAIQIRHYRNTLAHNPKLGMLLKEKEGILVPKESVLHKYELWSSVAKRSDNNDFVLLTELLSNFQETLIDKTNGLWAHLIAFMDKIVETDGYIRLASSNITIVFADDTPSSESTYTSISGAHPYDPTISSID